MCTYETYLLFILSKCTPSIYLKEIPKSQTTVLPNKNNHFHKNTLSFAYSCLERLNRIAVLQFFFIDATLFRTVVQTLHNVMGQFTSIFARYHTALINKFIYDWNCISILDEFAQYQCLQ